MVYAHRDKMVQKAFSLLECLIYIVILGILSILIFRFFVACDQQCKWWARQGQELMVLYATSDLLAHDIKKANSNVTQWNCVSSDKMILQCSNETIEWFLHKSNLYRIKGNYDYAQQNWLQKRQSLVAAQVKNFQYKIVTYDNSVIAVEIVLEIEQIKDRIEKTVYVGNRVL